MSARTTATRRSHVAVMVRNEVSRRGLRGMLESIPWVGEVTEAIDADWAPQHVPDLDLLIACQATAESRGSLLRSCSQAGTRVLVVLNRLDAATVRKVPYLPADGFAVETELTTSTLAHCLAQVGHNTMSVPASLAERLLAGARSYSPTPGHPYLTPREREVLSLLAEGLSNKLIASRLGVSPHAVKRHVGNVLAKLNSPNRTLAVAQALRDGLLPS
jgi:two-component system nitrate/nitrite response regulator NarL